MKPKQQSLPPPQPYPWLIYFSGEREKNQTFCSISDPTKTYSISIPELEESMLFNAQHGWCFRLNYIAEFVSLPICHIFGTHGTLRKLISLSSIIKTLLVIGFCHALQVKMITSAPYFYSQILV